MSDKEKAEIADRVSTAVDRVEASGIISPQTALKELKQSSRVTGIFSNITDEEIEAADDKPPDPSEMGDDPVPGDKPDKDGPEGADGEAEGDDGDGAGDE